MTNRVIKGLQLTGCLRSMLCGLYCVAAPFSGRSLFRRQSPVVSGMCSSRPGDRTVCCAPPGKNRLTTQVGTTYGDRGIREPPRLLLLRCGNFRSSFTDVTVQALIGHRREITIHASAHAADFGSPGTSCPSGLTNRPGTVRIV